MTFVVGVLLIGGIAYLTPTWIALCRGVPGWGWVFLINLLFGWSVLGYWMAFIYACGPTKAQLQWQARRERLSIEADEAVVELANRARAALQRRLP
jgi:MFS family permease